jgi:hypothetical protein
MKNYHFKILLLLLLPTAVFSQIKLEKQSLLDNKIELLIPVNLEPISQRMMEAKYPNMSIKPDVILSDKNGEIGLTITFSKSKIEESQLALFKDFQINLIKSKHPEMQLSKSDVKIINSKHVGYFKFITDAIDQKIYNCYFFTELNNRVLLITFNCIEKESSKWDSTVDEIINSLKLK